MRLSESDTRAKLIDPAIHSCGWIEDYIRREETDKGIDVVDGKPRRRQKGRIDYLLRIPVNISTQPIAIALIEAKANYEPPDKGLEQAKKYARLNSVPFVYSSNGHLFVEYNNFTGRTSAPIPLDKFPTPDELRKRCEIGFGFLLDSPAAKPLLVAYPGGEASRRYYQDAAIRAALENIAQGKKRMLLYLATGSGKTFIAVHILKKIADAGQLRRALFLCDRDELRTQGLGALQNIFGADAAPVSSSNAQKNARVIIATYQTLNVAGEEEDAKFLMENYPENYFSHIIIDECHRSAWGKWSVVLTRNSDAIQIGLTATPRFWQGGTNDERKTDEEITANNLEYFGPPIYEYDMAQGIEDGYLPACEVVKRETDLDKIGITRDKVVSLGAIDAITGQPVSPDEVRPQYEAPSYEAAIQLPDRVKAWCKDLFNNFINTGGPHQKTVIFCVRDTHADAVAGEMNTLYGEWCLKNNVKRQEPYAFKCTAAVGGSEYIADLRGSERSYYIATTVDLITTGVDVPILRNVVFFKYVRSPIAFQQMMGRGSRIHLPSNKLMFRVYDYTNATRLMGKEFNIRHFPSKEREGPVEPPIEKVIRVEGFEVHVNPAGTYIVTKKDEKLTMVSVEEYKQIVAEHLVQEVNTINDFREIWIKPQERINLINALPNNGQGMRMLREVLHRNEYDYYDVLAEIGYGIDPKTRRERVEALHYKHDAWLKHLPEKTAQALLALARQFEIDGTDGLENPHIFEAPEVIKSGGIQSLKLFGKPEEIIEETKRRLLAA